MWPTGLNENWPLGHFSQIDHLVGLKLASSLPPTRSLNNLRQFVHEISLISTIDDKFRQNKPKYDYIQ